MLQEQPDMLRIEAEPCAGLVQLQQSQSFKRGRLLLLHPGALYEALANQGWKMTYYLVALPKLWQTPRLNSHTDTK
jgi:hypothetical protein